MLRFSIVTPCLNSAKYIAGTIETVLNQTAVVSKRVDLEYHICDGGSTDGTVDLLEKYAAKYPCIKVASEKDNGMYDALSKGLKRCSGDICAYINAGDLYSLHAFDIVAELLGKRRGDWLTGYTIIYNEEGQIVYFLLPYRYRKRFFQCGFYDGNLLPYLQQESTFWKVGLNGLLDLEKLARFRLAGDYYIWREFSKRAALQIVETHLGGFRRQQGQLSGDKQGYTAELKSICTSPTLADRILLPFEYLIWKSPPSVKKACNKQNLFRYDFDTEQWV